jgi:hypothetical protein
VVWAIDFEFDPTIGGKVVKIASMIDEHNRVSLLTIVERSITVERRVDELERIFIAAGGPLLVLRMGNGPGLVFRKRYNSSATEGSACRTFRPARPKPAAKSSASTKPSKSTYARSPWHHQRTGWARTAPERWPVTIRSPRTAAAPTGSSVLFIHIGRIRCPGERFGPTRHSATSPASSPETSSGSLRSVGAQASAVT